MTLKDAAYGLLLVLEIPQQEHRYLLVLHQKGHWAFPKGHKEGNETDLEAARREIEEETGLVTYQIVPGVKFTESYQFTSKKGKVIDKTVTYFLAKIAVPELAATPAITVQEVEIADYRWCNFAEALETITFAANRQVLQECESYLQQG
ncbi:MAG: NUDIX domain-containing protein [Cyanobacteria bacterium P01_H01_bin.121]